MSEYLQKLQQEKLNNELLEKQRKLRLEKEKTLEREQRENEEHENRRAHEEGMIVEYATDIMDKSPKKTLPTPKKRGILKPEERASKIKKTQNLNPVEQGRCPFCHILFSGAGMMDHMRRRCPKYDQHFSTLKISNEAFQLIQNHLNNNQEVPTQEFIVSLIIDAFKYIDMESNMKKGFKDLYIIGSTELNMANRFHLNRAVGVDLYNATTRFKYWQKKQMSETKIPDNIKKNFIFDVNNREWEQACASYISAMDDIKHEMLKNVVQECYKNLYIGISEFPFKRKTMHCRGGIRSLLLKNLSPMHAIIAYSVAEDFGKKENMIVKDIVANGIHNKRLYQKIVLNHVSSECAFFAEYCLTVTCNPVLSAAQALEGHKAYKSIPIQMIYHIGAYLLLRTVLLEKKYYFSPWEDFANLAHPIGVEFKKLETDFVSNGLDKEVCDGKIEFNNFYSMKDMKPLFEYGGLLSHLLTLEQPIYINEDESTSFVYRPTVKNEAFDSIIKNVLESTDEIRDFNDNDNDFCTFDDVDYPITRSLFDPFDVLENSNIFDVTAFGSFDFQQNQRELTFNETTIIEIFPNHIRQNENVLCKTFREFIINYQPIIGNFGDKTWTRNNFIGVFGCVMYYVRESNTRAFLCPFCVYRNTEGELFKHIKNRHSPGPLRVHQICGICGVPITPTSMCYHKYVCFGENFHDALEKLCIMLDNGTIEEFYKQRSR